MVGSVPQRIRKRTGTGHALKWTRVLGSEDHGRGGEGQHWVMVERLCFEVIPWGSQISALLSPHVTWVSTSTLSCQFPHLQNRSECKTPHRVVAPTGDHT